MPSIKHFHKIDKNKYLCFGITVGITVGIIF